MTVIASKNPTHLDTSGQVHMVDVQNKPETLRRAVATASLFTQKDVLLAIADGQVPKGDVAAVIRVAAIMAAKKTADLIPLCHPISITKATCEVVILPDNGKLVVEVAVECVGRTGVEMEALTGATVGALTAYDMVKSMDRGAHIGEVFLREKDGGRSGHYQNDSVER